MTDVVTVLSGHTSPETAFVVADYPYGFRLRCAIRYWIETKEKKGQRVVSQTTNPKRQGHPWNKPKASTYAIVQVLFLDENEHVQVAHVTPYSDDDQIRSFMATYAEALTDRDRGFLEAFMKGRAAVREAYERKREQQRASHEAGQ